MKKRGLRRRPSATQTEYLTRDLAAVDADDPYPRRTSCG
jgi:hypothetical protein